MSKKGWNCIKEGNVQLDSSATHLMDHVHTLVSSLLCKEFVGIGELLVKLLYLQVEFLIIEAVHNQCLEPCQVQVQ